MIWEQRYGTGLGAIAEVFNSPQFSVLEQDFSAFAMGVEVP